jgi:hypothetical protein
MAPPPAHHHHQEKAYADFTHEQKEQEVGGAVQRRLTQLVLFCSLFYGIVFLLGGGGVDFSFISFSPLQYPRNHCQLCMKKKQDPVVLCGL